MKRYKLFFFFDSHRQTDRHTCATTKQLFTPLRDKNINLDKTKGEAIVNLRRPDIHDIFKREGSRLDV